jgi:hypothetical protein
LKLDDLLVHETGTIVHNLHRVGGFTDRARALGRLIDPAAINIDLDSMVADLASEEGIPHVGNDWCSANNQTFDCNDLIDV